LSSPPFARPLPLFTLFTLLARLALTVPTRPRAAYSAAGGRTKQQHTGYQIQIYGPRHLDRADVELFLEKNARVEEDATA
jgi:hypothetical protein